MNKLLLGIWSKRETFLKKGFFLKNIIEVTGLSHSLFAKLSVRKILIEYGVLQIKDDELHIIS